MWSPTHVQVAVKRAQALLTKGGHGTNDCFVTIALGKEKYQTSIKEKATPNVEWNEECELLIPTQGNTAEIVLTALHRNFVGVDEFLGTVRIPLSNFDIYERPRNRWYKLEAKKGKENKKERGELEVRIAFTVKAGSLTNLSNKEKHKSSFSQLAQSVGGSLLSIGTLEKRKSRLKKLAKSFGSKVHLSKKKDQNGGSEDDVSGGGSVSNLANKESSTFVRSTISEKLHENVDPGVISEDEDEFAFDDLSHISSTSSVCSPNLSSGVHSLKSSGNAVDRSTSEPVQKAPEIIERASPVAVDEWEQKLYGKQGKASTLPAESRSIVNIYAEANNSVKDTKDNISLHNEPVVQSPPKVTNQVEKTKDTDKSNKFTKKFKYFRKDNNSVDQELKNSKEKVTMKNYDERIIIGGEKEMDHSESAIPGDVLQKFEGKTRTELILLIMKLQGSVDDNKKKLRDLEDYLDQLLLRVMETTPKILQNPYKNGKVVNGK